MEDVTLSDLAAEIDMDRSALRKHCVKQGYKFGRRRTLTSRGQAAFTLRAEDAAEVRREFAWRTESIPLSVGRSIPTKAGLNKEWYDALVIEGGIPEQIASILVFHATVGGKELISRGGVDRTVAERECRQVAVWLEGIARRRLATPSRDRRSERRVVR